jgi:hypothetical protein
MTAFTYDTTETSRIPLMQMIQGDDKGSTPLSIVGLLERHYAALYPRRL